MTEKRKAARLDEGSRLAYEDRESLKQIAVHGATETCRYKLRSVAPSERAVIVAESLSEKAVRAVMWMVAHFQRQYSEGNFDRYAGHWIWAQRSFLVDEATAGELTAQWPLPMRARIDRGMSYYR